MFAKFKHLVGKAAERTHKATWRRIGTLFDAFSSTECQNHLLTSSDSKHQPLRRPGTSNLEGG